MGEREVTKKEWFCDVCKGAGGFCGTCEVCGKEFCSLCEFIGYNPLHLNICKAHKEDDDMKDIIGSFEKKVNNLREKMKNSIRRIGIVENLK